MSQLSLSSITLMDYHSQTRFADRNTETEKIKLCAVSNYIPFGCMAVSQSLTDNIVNLLVLDVHV